MKKRVMRDLVKRQGGGEKSQILKESQTSSVTPRSQNPYIPDDRAHSELSFVQLKHLRKNLDCVDSPGREDYQDSFYQHAILQLSEQKRKELQSILA